jgi:pilus assembly protein CpaB
VNTRRVTLIVAVVLALGTGILTLRYLSSIQQQANVQQQSVEMKSIVIANRDIPARAKITPDMLTKVSRPANQVEPGALDDPKLAMGDISLITIPSGTTLTETKVGRPADVGLTVRLKPGMRAISIPVDRVKAVSGLIEPGDRVDVLAAVPKGNGTQPRAVTIIRGALVLALNDSLETAGATPSPDNANLVTVTLGITPQQSDLLTMADLNTTLRLALRSPQEPVRSLEAETLTFPDTTGSSGSSAPEPAAAPAPPAYPIAAAPLPAAVQAPPIGYSPVTVIDGDRVVTQGR